MKLIVNRGFDRAFTRITVLRNGQQAISLPASPHRSPPAGLYESPASHAPAWGRGFILCFPAGNTHG